jgi:copper chaperone CopZ
MEKRTFEVPNIGCDGCVRTIQNEVKAIPGVSRVEGSVDSRMVTVEWNAPADWQQIADKLAEIDYAPSAN